MQRFQCRVEYLSVAEETKAMLRQGMAVKAVYKELLQLKKINMGYLQFYRYCKGKVKGIKSCFEEEKTKGQLSLLDKTEKTNLPEKLNTNSDKVAPSIEKNDFM